MTDQILETVNQQQETVTKQKNPLRIEQGKRLIEYNCLEKEELKCLNEQITKQDGIEHNLSLIQILMYMSAVSVCLD